MPPWLDWVDHFGADALGRLTGLWLNFCLSLPRRFVHLLARVWTTRHRSQAGSLGKDCDRPSHSNRLVLSRLGKVIVSTSLTLLLWSIITWKPFWIAAGRNGERILSAVLLLLSASWVISLFWICFFKPRRSKVAVPVGSSADARSKAAGPS